jgi:uncharacterized membrane protein YcjF (UPF0283 family)
VLAFLSDTAMSNSEWAILIGLVLFALLVLRRLGTINKTLRSALIPSPEFNKPGYLFHDVSEIKDKIDSLHKSLGSLDEKLTVIREHMRAISLTAEEVQQTLDSEVKGLHAALGQIDGTLAGIDQRLNPENNVYSWKPGW